jgi:oligopeptide transport system permease protein
MGRFFIKRLIQIIFVLLGVTILTFILVRLVPGSPWDKNWGQRSMVTIFIDDHTLEALNRHYGFDQPAWQQFIRYIIGWKEEGEAFSCGVICGNLGVSYRLRGFPIQEMLFGISENGATFWDSRMGYSIRLTSLAFILTMVLGLLTGTISALYMNTWVDKVLSFLAVIGVATPNFIIGLLLLLLFASILGVITILPDWDRPVAWVIPAFVLAIPPASMLGRLTRTSLVEVIHQDFVRTARAKGASERRVIGIHVVRNALIPILTFVGPVFMELLASSFVIEAMFGLPGIGREYWESIRTNDYSMAMSLTLLYAVAIALANLAVDLAYTLVDPRLRNGWE